MSRASRVRNRNHEILENLSPQAYLFLQRICYKRAATIDMTQNGFIRDSKATPVNLLLKPLRERLEQICGPSRVKAKGKGKSACVPNKKVIKSSGAKTPIASVAKPTAASTSVTQVNTLRHITRVNAATPITTLNAARPNNKVNAARPISRVNTARSMNKLNAARPIGAVNAARHMGTVNAARPIGTVNTMRPIGRVNAAKPIAKQAHVLKPTKVSFNLEQLKR